MNCQICLPFGYDSNECSLYPRFRVGNVFLLLWLVFACLIVFRHFLKKVIL